MDKIILFAGTTEGREIAKVLNNSKYDTLVCVATEYGENLIEDLKNVVIRSGRLDVQGMKKLFYEQSPDIIIDATHPYAVEVSQNIKNVCEDLDIKRIRVKRDALQDETEGIYKFDSLDTMIEWANQNNEIIFSTMGAKEAYQLTKIRNYNERVYIRILPTEESYRICNEYGYDNEHLIVGKGPFSKEENLTMFKESGAAILITKESGVNGGYPEKIDAAKELNMKIAVLKRPVEAGINIEQVTKLIVENRL